MEQYESLEPIGSGSFGIIRKIKRKSDGRLLARKEIDYKKMSEKERKQLVSEVNILRELRHSNIVRYYERYVDRENCRIYIVMEYCEGGDLAAVIRRCRKEKRNIPEDVVWSLASQLLHALQECHNAERHSMILHRDIKPENVFLDKHFNVKLGDFGLSRMIGNPQVEFAQTYVGTPYYMSPELVEDSRYNSKTDIWALGCLIYELCALEPPFQSKTHTGLAAKIKAGKIKPLPKQYSNELQSLILSMFTLDYEKRPEAADFLGHPRIRLAQREMELVMLDKLRAREEEIKKRTRMLDQRETELENLASQLQTLKIDLERRESELINRMGDKENTMDITERIETSVQDFSMYVSPVVDKIKSFKTPGTASVSKMLNSPSTIERKPRHRVFQLRQFG